MVEVTGKSHRMLFMNTLAFTIAFATWMTNGVLVTYLVDNRIYDWDPVAMGWLIGIPVLTGAIFRLPAGILTDKYGGKWVVGGTLLFVSIPMYLMSKADTYEEFLLCSLGFGLAGTIFSSGIAFTSVWYPKKWQGTALGIFGAGNAGAALTTLVAPTLIKKFTDNGANIDGWRDLPVAYAIMVFTMGVLFLLLTENKKASGQEGKTLAGQLRTLKDARVWRYGLQYFLVFGMFVAFAQWLVPYFVNVYYLPLVMAGFFVSFFSFPSGVIRALGGYLSDKFGAIPVMYWVAGTSLLFAIFLSIPKMEVYSPGKGVVSFRAGTVTEVTDTYIQVDDKKYNYHGKDMANVEVDKAYHLNETNILPTKEEWQEPVVKVGDKVNKKELLAKGVTKVYFMANVYIFAVLAIIIGAIWGIGKAAVYKMIPDHFPNDVGVVGGMVGVIGGLGGFVGPIVFGYLLKYSGLWISSWVFILVLSSVCLILLSKESEVVPEHQHH
ncbi:MAG: transporter, family, nitrate/nitrite transporter [Campylobacterota bacterium]|nr:transporter, family, nitrate/nitrite transporter [Campylobacterota bacterium]